MNDIVQKLYVASLGDAKSLEEAIFSVSVWQDGDIVAEAEAVVKSCAHAIPCEACRRDVKKYDSQFFAAVDFGGEVGRMRWFRLCEDCGEAVIKDDDQQVLFLVRTRPSCAEEWSNGSETAEMLFRQRYPSV